MGGVCAAPPLGQDARTGSGDAALLRPHLWGPRSRRRRGGAVGFRETLILRLRPEMKPTLARAFVTPSLSQI